jgi:hypothetical protein
MKTDELIDMLGTNVEPVKGGQLRNTLFIALTVGAVAALCLMLAIFGAPDEAFRGDYFGLTMLALAFTLGLVVAGATFLIRAARPGGKSGSRPLVFIGLLFLAILSAGLVALLLRHPDAWGGMIFGPEWAACLICIPLLSIAPFASLIWALRKEAPTDLARTGAVTGLVAGALGAAAFAFHHPGDSIPFIVLWFGGAIVLCTLAGAILGPRLLRW